MDFAGGQLQFSPAQGFGRSARSTSHGRGISGGSSGRADSLQVGDVAHLLPITSDSEEDLGQLQQDLRMLNDKTVSSQWYMSESLGDRMKLLQLYQTGMNYLHYSNNCRKDVLQDIVRQNERKDKEIKHLKKTIDKQREHLYDLKDQYNVRKEAVKKYRAYLEKLHFCQKCKKPVRSMREHEKKHEKESLKEQKAGPEPPSEMLTALMKENQAILRRLEQMNEERIDGQENMRRLLDELKTIKLEVHVPKSSSPPKATAAVGTSEIEYRSKTPENNSGNRLSNRPSIQTASRVLTEEAELISPIMKNRRESQPDPVMQMNFDDLPNDSVEIPRKESKNNGPHGSGMNDAGRSNVGSTFRGMEEEIDKMLTKTDSEGEGNYGEEGFEIDDDAEQSKKKSPQLNELNNPVLEQDLNMESCIRPNNKAPTPTNIPNSAISFPSDIGILSKTIRRVQEPITPPHSSFRDLATESHIPVRRKDSMSKFEDKKYIDDMVENTDSNNSQSGGPANNVRSHVDMAEQEENRLLLSSAIPDNLSLDPIMQGNTNSEMDISHNPESNPHSIRRVESPKAEENSSLLSEDPRKSMLRKSNILTSSTNMSMPEQDLNRTKSEMERQRVQPADKPNESCKQSMPDDYNLEDTRSLETKPQRKNNESVRVPPLVLNNIEEKSEENIPSSMDPRQKTKIQAEKDEVDEEIDRVLSLTPKEESHKKNIRQQYDKILMIRDGKISQKDLQRDINREIETASDNVEREFRQMFDTNYAGLSKENPMVIGNYLRQISETIQTSKNTLESMKKQTNQTVKRNLSQLDNSLEISQSGSAFKELESKNRSNNSKNKEPSLDFELKGSSIIRNTPSIVVKPPPSKVQSKVQKPGSQLPELPEMREQSLLRPPPSIKRIEQGSRNGSITTKEIKNFDVDDPIESNPAVIVGVNEGNLRSELAKRSENDSFSDD